MPGQGGFWKIIVKVGEIKGGTTLNMARGGHILENKRKVP